MTTLSQTVESAVAPTRALLAEGAAEAVGEVPPPPNPARAVQQVAGAVMGAMAVPMELLNTGVAVALNGVADVLPSFPAAHLGSLYVGAPHMHAHPPSLAPPAPPVPLPSIGAVSLGTSLRVLVGGLPAARVGDLGIAPTCGGFAPFFQIFLGSSKVFLGGARAARMTDICTACTPSSASGISKMAVAMSALGMVADLADAATMDQAEMASAYALSAAMEAAQIAQDAVAAAISASMGSDPAIPPALPGFIMLGAPNVLIAGVPLPAMPDPAGWLKNKVKRVASAAARKAAGKLRSKKGGGGGCGG